MSDQKVSIGAGNAFKAGCFGAAGVWFFFVGLPPRALWAAGDFVIFA